MNGGDGLPPGNRAPRFPGFDVLAEQDHWDDATRSTVLKRIHSVPPVRFFTPEEEAIATCLLDRLMGQDEPEDPHRIALLHMVDRRLVERETDGWHYDTMPQDDQAWRDTVAGLDEDARERYGRGFPECDIAQQRELLAAVQESKADRWHGMPPKQVWSLWTRYAATAFYSHPEAWNEMGFPGPAYPRGYKNRGVNRWEPFEVPDARPDDDPVAGRNE